MWEGQENCGEYQILTDDGYKNFAGIRRKRVLRADCITLYCDDDNCITTTPDHLLKMSDGKWKKVCDITANESVLCDGGVVSVCRIENGARGDSESIYTYVYDVLDSENKNYIASGFVNHNCEFLSTSLSFLNRYEAKRLADAVKEPLAMGYDNKMKIWHSPVEENQYVVMVDPSQGVGLDYSAIGVVDVTKAPYVLVAHYQDNEIEATNLSVIIADIAKKYNNAYVMIEYENGVVLARELREKLGYYNIFTTRTRQQGGIELYMRTGVRAISGVKMSYGVKKIGCEKLKDLIVSDSLKIYSKDMSMQLTNFVAGDTDATKKTFSAAKGTHDDLVMTMVIFGWLTSQTLFYRFCNVPDFRDEVMEDFVDEKQLAVVPIRRQESDAEVNQQYLRENHPLADLFAKKNNSQNLFGDADELGGFGDMMNDHNPMVNDRQIFDTINDYQNGFDDVAGIFDDDRKIDGFGNDNNGRGGVIY